MWKEEDAMTEDETIRRCQAGQREAFRNFG